MRPCAGKQSPVLRLLSEFGPVPAHDAASYLQHLRRGRSRAAGRALPIADVEIHDQRIEFGPERPVAAWFDADEDVPVTYSFERTFFQASPKSA
jgi:hypothetical protein